ncbi:hypothetical protein APHAL10511_001650 [Amanita phalloides]|nr:hypothetical protein APHAL10511_001650 [Amanita phalloides]
MAQHRILESPNSREIHVEDWVISASTNPISSAQDCDVLQALLGLPLPEMTFGSNYLTLHHHPTSWKYTFDIKGALGSVKKGELGPGDGGVKVGHADKWLQSRTDPSSLLPMPKTVVTKPYDWTYTSTYPGHIIGDAFNTIPWRAADPGNASHAIPMAELTRQDPILFYAEIPLYEDELHDNGSSALLIRIRVMPACIFILSRFTLRVDHVIFRTFDTRIYHSFHSNPPMIIRETHGWEASYERVQRVLPKRDDLTPLTDPTWIAKILSEMPLRDENTGWRGLVAKTEIAELKTGKQ